MLKLCNSEQFAVLTSQFFFTFGMKYVHKHLPRSYLIQSDLFQVDKVKCVGFGYSTGYWLLYTARHDLHYTKHFSIWTQAV